MKNQRRYPGYSLIEFAMIFPLAFFMISGFLDLGRAVFYYSSLTNAVREGTRYAIVHQDEISAAFNNPSDNSLQDDIFVTIEKVNKLFKTVSIEATYPFKPITPGIQVLLGGEDGIDLIVQSKMHVTPGAK